MESGGWVCKRKGRTGLDEYQNIPLAVCMKNNNISAFLAYYILHFFFLNRAEVFFIYTIFIARRICYQVYSPMMFVMHFWEDDAVHTCRSLLGSSLYE